MVTPTITTPDAPTAPDTLAELELETPAESETLTPHDRGLPPRPEQLREMRRMEAEMQEAIMACREAFKERRRAYPEETNAQWRAAFEDFKARRRAAQSQ